MKVVILEISWFSISLKRYEKGIGIYCLKVVRIQYRKHTLLVGILIKRELDQFIIIFQLL